MFFEGLKNQHSTFFMSTYGFHKFWLKKFRRTYKIKFLLASMKSLIVKILAGTIFRKLVPAFWEASVTLKLFRKPPVILKIVPKVIHECKSTDEREGKPKQNFDVIISSSFLLPENLTHSKPFQARSINISMPYFYSIRT